jgi:putative copper export protein
MTGDTATDALLVVSRLIWYVGLVGVIGTSAFRLFISSHRHPGAAGIDRAAAASGVAAAAVLVVGVLARLYAQAYASFGLEEPVTAALLLDVATELPPWSTGWLAQLGAALASLVALTAAWSGRRAAWTIAHVAVLVLAAATPLTGHAVAQDDWYTVPIVLHAFHVLGAGLWIGGLSMLLVVGVTCVVQSPGLQRETLAALVHAFSPLALCGASLLALTGGAMALVYLNAVADLWMTAYGRILALKVAMVGGVALLGFINWRRVRPQVAHAGGAQRLRRTGGLELALAAIVLALTALLVGEPQPAE